MTIYENNKKWLKRGDSQELLEFYRNEKIREIPAHENNEDEFSNITGVITKWNANCSSIQSEKILFKVLVTI